MGYQLPETQQCMDNGPDMTYMNYPAYGWENPGMWPNATGEMVQQDEYDINAIPPVELSIPDYSEEIHSSSSTLAMAVGPQHGDFSTPRPNGGDESDMFTGMFSYNEPAMMW